MTTKHTPGPWRVDTAMDSDGTIRSVDVREGAYGLFIAAVEAHTEEHADVMANARLIAAAPDLLAALRAALNWEYNRPSVEDLAARNDRESQRIANYYMEVPKWVHEARAAIARAEGNE